MGKKKPATQTTTTNSSGTSTRGPLEAQSGAYTDLWNSAQNAFNTSDRSGALNRFEQAAQTSAESAAGRANTGVDGLRTLAQDQIAGKYLDPATNPHLQANVNAAIDPMKQQLLRDILPSIQSQAIAQGAYGGSRNGIQNGLAVGEFDRNALNTASQMYARNYENERGIQQNSAGLLNDAGRLDLAGSQILSALGTGQRNIQNEAPWTGMDRLAAILGSGGFTSGTDTNNSTQKTVGTPASGGLGSALQGAAGGASAGSSFGPWGAAIGGALGGLGSLFG
jgi:hypothetical protein